MWLGWWGDSAVLPAPTFHSADFLGLSERAVINTGPLVGLSLAGRLDLLPTTTLRNNVPIV